MKQSEKLDLLLCALNKHPGGRYADIISLLKNEGIEVTMDDAQRLGEKLGGKGLVRYISSREGAYIAMKSEGVEFLEKDSFTLPGSPVTPRNQVGTSALSVETPERIKSQQTEQPMKDVFVTYAWESPDYQQYVASFVSLLRREGYTAEMDLLKTQEETAIDFMKMMHQATTDYRKVIIFLSPKYKERAEKFTGGVGIEYELIIKDIRESLSKYILVSTFGISSHVTPRAFSHKEVVELSDPPNQSELNRIYAKLNDEPLYTFAPVGAKKPVVTALDIQPFMTDEEVVTIKGVDAKLSASQQIYGGFVAIDFNLTASIQNISPKPVLDFGVDVVIPVELSRHLSYEDLRGMDHRYEEGNIVFSYKIAKLSPRRPYHTGPIPIKVWNQNAGSLLEKAVTVIVYTDSTTPQKDFLLKDVLWKDDYGVKSPLTKNDFYMD